MAEFPYLTGSDTTSKLEIEKIEKIDILKFRGFTFSPMS